MKAIILLFIACVFSVSTMADEPKAHGDKYCAKMKDGKMVVMHDGGIITDDVTLASGTRIKPDATVVMSDGRNVVLKEGECVDKDGNIKVKPKK